MPEDPLARHYLAPLFEPTSLAVIDASERAGAVIVSASGMCDGGRIKHHLRYSISHPECAIVFAGFQAAGTLGRRTVDGAKSVRIFGEPYPLRAKVFTIGGLSSRADRASLPGWLGNFKRPPRQTWVVHGESIPSLALRDELRRRGWNAQVPAPGRSVDIEGRYLTGDD